MKYLALLIVAVVALVLFSAKKPSGIYQKTGAETSVEHITQPVAEPRAKVMPKSMTRARSYAPPRTHSRQDRNRPQLRETTGFAADEGRIYYLIPHEPK